LEDLGRIAKCVDLRVDAAQIAGAAQRAFAIPRRLAAVVHAPRHGGGTYDIIGPTGSSLGYPTVAAKAGDVVELYATGFGPTNPAVPPGQAFSGAAGAVDAVNVKIGSWNVTPPFAGLSGAGLVQINLTIPGGLGTGDIPLVATVGGSQTPSTVVISLQ
jgi:uncharacterized protein (TIGR03437 family)